MISKNIKISVLFLTYNHENYIRKAIRSILQQDFNGHIELVIADDCSSDRTLDIIREFEGEDSRFVFNYLDSTVNLGVTKNYQRGFYECSGEFVAVIEGDDYWVSPSKLQRQFDFLQKHWECDLCSVNYFVYDENFAKFTARVDAGDGYRLLGARELIFDNLVGNFSTCMYRKTALDALPKGLFEIKSYDWIVNICIARHSLIGFIELPMSVYRIHSAGVWSKKTDIEKLSEQLHILPAYDALTEYIFHQDFDLLASNLEKAINNKHARSSLNNSMISAPTKKKSKTLFKEIIVSIKRNLLSRN